MLKLAICNMCYIDEYTCAFKEYYYKGAYSIEESKEIRKLYFNKLPEPFSSKIIKSWEEAKIVDTLGARIKYLQQMVSELSNLNSTEEIYVRVRIYMLELKLELKNLPTKILN